MFEPELQVQAVTVRGFVMWELIEVVEPATLTPLVYEGDDSFSDFEDHEQPRTIAGKRAS